MERRPKTPAGLRTWLLLPWAEPLGSCLPSGGPTQDDKHLGETECSGLRLGGPGAQGCAGGVLARERGGRSQRVQGGTRFSNS